MHIHTDDEEIIKTILRSLEFQAKMRRTAENNEARKKHLSDVEIVNQHARTK